MSRMWYIIVFALLGCSNTAELELELSNGESFDVKRLATLTAAYLDEWDRVVGYRDKTIAMKFTHTNPYGKGVAAGKCSDKFGFRTIYIYTDKVVDDEHFKVVFFHELAHAHLKCNEEDHVNNPDSVLNDTYVHPIDFETDVDTLSKLGVL